MSMRYNRNMKTNEGECNIRYYDVEVTYPVPCRIRVKAENEADAIKESEFVDADVCGWQDVECDEIAIDFQAEPSFKIV